MPQRASSLNLLAAFAALRVQGNQHIDDHPLTVEPMFHLGSPYHDAGDVGLPAGRTGGFTGGRASYRALVWRFGP